MKDFFSKSNVEISKSGNLYFLLNALIGAYNRRTDVLARDGADGSEVLTAINNLSRKVDTMSSNIDRIEKEAADLAEDVTIIKAAQGELKALVADLKAQVAQGQIDQARLDAAATKLEQVDDDLDALTTSDTGGEPPPTT